MNKNTMKIMAIGIFAITLIIAGFGGSNSVYAQTTTPETPETVTTPGRQGFGLFTEENYLAETLGLTVEEVQAAQAEAFDLAVEDALADGLITDAQVEMIQSAPGLGWALLTRLVGSEAADDFDRDAYLAEALGISVEALEEARSTAQTGQIDQLVKGGVMTQEQADLMTAHRALFQSEGFQAEVKASIQAAIQNAVSAGTLSQTQADALLAQLENRNSWGMGFGGPAGMKKGMRGSNQRGMFGQGGQGMFGQGGQGMFGQGGQGMFGQGGQGMFGQGNQGSFGQGMFGQGMNGRGGNGGFGGQGMNNGLCDGTCPYAPTTP